MCVLFHNWDKWEEYDEKVPDRVLSTKWMLSGAIDHRQKRKCKKCGKVQDKFIRTTVI